MTTEVLQGFPVELRITKALASENYDAIVLFLADGFGWRFFERFQEAAFFKRIARQGKIEKIISQFPSTTAAHLTTIHTGLNVGQSGVYEWYYYEPQVDAVIAPLLFSYAGEKYRDTLKPTKIEPSLDLSTRNFLSTTQTPGRHAVRVRAREYTPSTYLQRGDGRRGTASLQHAVRVARQFGRFDRKEESHIRASVFDKIDSLCHEYGPNSPQVEAEIETFLLMLEHYFERIFTGKGRILFLMTADHGMAEVDPQTTVFLNTRPEFKGIERFIKTNRAGKPLVPAGRLAICFSISRKTCSRKRNPSSPPRLEGRADVVKTGNADSEGYFGDGSLVAVSRARWEFGDPALSI
jgi:predicted AlkP superfamily pyrophosphatase or phosphodiesterase